MTNKHIERLELLRDGLVARRRHAVEEFGSHDPRADLENLVTLHSRIEAVEAMLAHERRLEGAGDDTISTRFDDPSGG